MHKLAQLAINAEGFVFNPATGDSFQVSPTGLVVINGLRDGKSEEELAQQLTGAYEISLEEARRDLADFRGSLKSLGLV
jgi:hypothetical protein